MGGVLESVYHRDAGNAASIDTMYYFWARMISKEESADYSDRYKRTRKIEEGS